MSKMPLDCHYRCSNSKEKERDTVLYATVD